MEVYQDEWGNYFDAEGRQLSINDLIARGIDVVGAWSSRSPYYSPDDPRYQQGRGGYPYGYPSGYPAQQLPGGNFVPGTLNTQGFQLNWWTAALIGLLVGAFLLGKKR